MKARISFFAVLLAIISASYVVDAGTEKTLPPTVVPRRPSKLPTVSPTTESPTDNPTYEPTPSPVSYFPSPWCSMPWRDELRCHF